jgi:hypothetical protein
MRLREIISIVESMENQDHTFYHVTLTKNLGSIMEKGLVPSVGERSKKLKEPSAVFLFATREDAEDGATNWMVDEFEDEAFALLEITLPPEIEVHKDPSSDNWEVYVKDVIPSSSIRVLTRDL